MGNPLSGIATDEDINYVWELNQSMGEEIKGLQNRIINLKQESIVLNLRYRTMKIAYKRLLEKVEFGRNEKNT